jgi:hypothetical protein
MITVNSLEVDIGVRFVRRPMPLKIEQEARPISWKAIFVEVLDGEREGVVDADEGRGVRREFLAKPFGETRPRPISPRTGRGLNLYRFAGALGNVNPEPYATGFGRLRAGVVDADVAIESRLQTHASFFSGFCLGLS